jgi:hypothetical protein
MNWKSIRLELARTPEFPHGSPSRAYLLRLPLLESGAIDEGALREDPAHATVRRFWPNQKDMIGYVVRALNGWAFGTEPGKADEGAIFLDAHPLSEGQDVTVIEPDGRRLPFRVASLRQLH